MTLTDAVGVLARALTTLNQATAIEDRIAELERVTGIGQGA